ncbi:hypothetical protein Tco_0223284 [Tanacetum coccineum]
MSKDGVSFYLSEGFDDSHINVAYDGELHYLLDKVVSVGTAPGPNSSDHNVNTITNGDEMPKIWTILRNNIPQNKGFNTWESSRKMETKDTLSSCSNSEEQQMQQIQDKAKKSCMVSFRQLHSHLKLLSKNNLNGTRTESGFKRAFARLFGQDIETFTGTMFMNMDQLEKQPDKEEFQEIGSMAAFKVLETQFQMFIKSRMYMDDEYVVMTRNYFLTIHQHEIPEFSDTLNLRYQYESIDAKEQSRNKSNNSWLNERELQTTEEIGLNRENALDLDWF